MQGNQAAYSTLVADAPGVVTAVEAEPGIVVAAGTPVLRLAHDGPRDVVFAVPEDRSALLRALAAQPGALQVRLWGGERAAAGHRARGGRRGRPGHAHLPGQGRRRRAPMCGWARPSRVLIELPRSAGVTKLPLTAVTEAAGPDGRLAARPATMTVQSAAGRRWPVPRATTWSSPAGLAPGQTVVTAGVHVLTPGQKVKLYGEPRPRRPAPAASR